MKILSTLIALLLTLGIQPVFAEQEADDITLTDGPKGQPMHQYKDGTKIPGGLFFGAGHAYILNAPKGWVLDNVSGRSQGLVGVFYPKGGSWENSLAVMYSRVQPREGRTFDAMIKEDLAFMQKQKPALKVSEQLPIPYGRHGKKASIRYLDSGPREFEAVAYMEEKNWVVLVVLTARSQEERSSALPAFRELVQSFVYVTDHMEIKN